jgi:hypothetical protein
MLFGSSRGRLRGDGVCAFSPLSGSTTVVVFSWYLAPAWRWGLLFLLCSLQRRYVKMQNVQRTLFFVSPHTFLFVFAVVRASRTERKRNGVQLETPMRRACVICG